MITKTTTTLLPLTLFFFLSFGLFAQQEGYGLMINKTPVRLGSFGEIGLVPEPVLKSLPFFGKALHKRGDRNELPFGLGISGFSYAQDFIATSLKLKSVSPITGQTINAQPDTMIQQIRAGELQLLFKPNVWLLPFLNVYGIVGFTRGEVHPNLIIPRMIIEFPGLDQPIIIDTTIEISDNVPYQGFVYGGGINLAFGFRCVFVSVDYHYTETIPSDIDSKFVNQFFSPKVGILFSLSKKVSFSLWGGTMYFTNKQTFSGKVDVNQFSKTLAQIIGNEADYTGTIHPVSKWNLLAGTQFDINGRHHIFFEGGFVNRIQLTFGYLYRF